MKSAQQIAAMVVLTTLVAPLYAAEDDAEAFGQFQEVLESIDQNSFEMFRKFLDPTDLSNRATSYQPVEGNVREIFAGNFWEIIETGVLRGLPPADSNVKAKLVQFSFQDGRGSAAVRFSLPNYKFIYHVFDLLHDRRGRLKITDWFDSSSGQMFSASISDELVTVMPTKEATRRLLSNNSPTDLQLFQVTEILKATRDRQPPRFFEIYDEFDDNLQGEPLIAKRAVVMAYSIKDIERLVHALEIYVAVYAGDPKLALMISDYYAVVQDYDKSYDSLRRFQQNFAVNEGALPAKLSALALAIGKVEDAETFAVEATLDEPGLELGWWSLLRARAGAEDYQGSLEALTYLEDNFDHRLDAAKLRRDRFKAFTQLANSQVYKDWRAARN